jgi:NDP-sugar pyrophosphorylase family protein
MPRNIGKRKADLEGSARHPMQIVIPMSGFGERFRRAGYTVPKPLIPVEGKPIIAHVVDLFPGETRFIFICNQDHLDNPDYGMRETLETLCPTGKIIGIPPHKLGPANAVIAAAEEIDLSEPTIINYCDFSCVWDYDAFKNEVLSSACDGAIACYSGFHPHMLGSVNYAYVKETSGWVEDIQEKKPWTQSPMDEFASSGTYYFRSGALALDAIRELMKRPDLALNGEFYISLAYKPLLEEQRKISVFAIEYFMQWGTPEDLTEYNSMSKAFRLLATRSQRAPQHAGTLMIPMAGAGSRFTAAGYASPKPLISVSGRPMAFQAISDLPHTPTQIFVLRRDLPQLEVIQSALKQEFSSGDIVTLDEITDGQARTCLMAMHHVHADSPLTIGACDNGALYDASGFEALWEDPAVDVIVWAARGHAAAARNPRMYGWIDALGDRIVQVSVKEPLSHPHHDPIVIGAFTFRRAADFRAAAERMISRGAKVNGEFYVDTCVNDAIALGLNVRLFEVDSFLCWGTPNELATFQYWQACFNKWTSHPYRLELDADVPRSRN